MKEKSKISPIRVLALFIVVCVALWVFMNPSNSYDFGIQDYWKLQPGMTYEEVVSILGGDGELISRDRETENNQQELYSWTSKRGGSVQISFQNGKLVSKAEFDLAD